MSDYKYPITIYYTGHQDCPKGHDFGPAVRPHYLIHFVTSGKGIFKVKNKVYEISENQCFMIKPREVTYYKADDENPWTYSWIAFDGENIESFFENFNWIDDYRVGTIEKSEACISNLKNIVESFSKQEKNNLELLGYFYLCFDSLKKNITETRQINDRTYLDQALRFIRHNYSYGITILEISDHIGIERSYLYKLFKKHLNVSPKEYLTDYRLLVAKELLWSTSLKTTEIAASCGFSDASVFCKNFKKHEGMTPIEYRNL